MAKSPANAKQHHKAELWLFKNYLHSPSKLSPKNNRSYSKKRKQKKCGCIHEIIRLIIMNIEKIKKKNVSHWYVVNRPLSKHGLKYSRYKTCLSMIVLICNQQHLSNIWSSIHEKLKQHWGWVKKSIAYKKIVYFTKLPKSQTNLESCGYKKKKPIYSKVRKTKRNQTKLKRNIKWFNPPYGKTVKTNIGKYFFLGINKHFPPQHKFCKISTRNTLATPED